MVDVAVRIELATFDFTSFDSCYLYNQAGVCGDGTCQLDGDGDPACVCSIGFGGEFCADSTSTSESLAVSTSESLDVSTSESLDVSASESLDVHQ